MNRSISIFKRGAYTSRNQFTGLSFHFVLKRRKTLISPAMECSRLFGRRALCNCRLIVSRFNWLTESFFSWGEFQSGKQLRHVSSKHERCSSRRLFEELAHEGFYGGTKHCVTTDKHRLDDGFWRSRLVFSAVCKCCATLLIFEPLERPNFIMHSISVYLRIHLDRR